MYDSKFGTTDAPCEINYINYHDDCYIECTTPDKYFFGTCSDISGREEFWNEDDYYYEENDDDDEGISGGGIAAIVAIVIFTLFIFAICLCCRKRLWSSVCPRQNRKPE